MSDSNFPYCFVCSRPTDHVGEHDALVAAGMAAYSKASDGSDELGCTVFRTLLWQDHLAKQVGDAEYVLSYGSEADLAGLDAATRSELLEVRASLEAAIDQNMAMGATSTEPVDWTGCQRLFEKGLSLLLGSDVKTFAGTNG